MYAGLLGAAARNVSAFPVVGLLNGAVTRSATVAGGALVALSGELMYAWTATSIVLASELHAASAL